MSPIETPVAEPGDTATETTAASAARPTPAEPSLSKSSIDRLGFAHSLRFRVLLSFRIHQLVVEPRLGETKLTID